jgi:hypothetical protein
MLYWKTYSDVRGPGLERVREPELPRRGDANPVPSRGHVQLLVSAQCHARHNAGTAAPPSGGAEN